MFMAIKLPKEQKTEIVKNVQSYFEDELAQPIGELGADQFIDFMIKELGPYIYNKAVDDVRKLINEKMNQIDDELYALEKPTTKWKR